MDCHWGGEFEFGMGGMETTTAGTAVAVRAPSLAKCETDSAELSMTTPSSQALAPSS